MDPTANNAQAERHRGGHKKRPIEGITKPALGRVARRAGVKQVSRPVYEEARAALNAFLTKIVQDCTLYAEHGHRKTIVASDVEMALNRNGRPMYGFRVD